MKKIILILTIILSISCMTSYAGEYYELEEWNSDANGIVYDPDPNAPMNDVVWYYDRYGCRRYTTRIFAQRGGLSAGGYYPYWRRPVLTGPGKYRREVRAEEKKGLLTRVLEILL
jgi:hypothetical protein